MITIAKLKEYEEYRGYFDGFYIQKVKPGKNATSDNEWYLINTLIQDVRMVQNGLAAKQFTDSLNDRLKENCDSEETVRYLKLLATKNWGNS